MKTDRLISIIMLLLEKDKITADELAETFEVSTRTIYRDIDSINLAGIPVSTQTGPGNGISILKSYKFEKKLFSTSDITNLLLALNTLQSIPSQNIKSTLNKIKSMLPSDNQKELNFKANQIKIELTPWLYSNNYVNNISIIKKAMEQQFYLRFNYCDNKNNVSSREIEPYCLFLKEEDWYIQGYCVTRDDFRTFKLLRMQQVQIIEKTFVLKNIPLSRNDSMKFNNETLLPIKLKIHERIKDKIISRFGDECIICFEFPYYVVSVLMPINHLACHYILGFGSSCECLEPVEMRSLIQNIATDLYNIYNTSNGVGGGD